MFKDSKINTTIFHIVFFIAIYGYVFHKLLTYFGYVDIPLFVSTIYLIKLLYIIYFFISLYFGKVKKDIFTVIFFVFFALIFFKVLLNYDLYGNTRNDYLNSFEYHKTFLIDLIFFFSVGCLIPNESRKKIEWVYIAAFFVLSSIIITNIDYSMMRLDINAFVSREYKSSYILLSDYFVLVSFFVLFFVKDEAKQTLIILLSLFCVFFLISRTTFAIYLIIFVFYLYHKLISYSILVRILAIMSVFMTIGFVFFVNNEFLLLLEKSGSRMLSILDMSGDFSLSQRTAMFNSAIDNIANNPITGYFGGQLKYGLDFGHEERWGAYSHNILSYYRQFGLITFLLLIVLCAYSIYEGISNKKHSIFIFYGFMFFLIELLVSRSYIYSYIFIFIGFYLSNGKKYKV